MEDGWYFEEMGDKSEQNADLLTKHAFENDVATFVRETLQNANDAQSAAADGPVEVYYRLEKLTGAELEEFKDELNWRSDGDDGLYDHLRAAGKVEDDRQLDQFLDHLEETGELLLLSIEDRNTEGLDGTETEDGTNYTALIRDMGRSNKEGTEGGSHGVGKTVLWAFSGVSTVLFTSYPERRTAGHKAPRFVGRTLLPDHRDEETDQLYSGNGWYGRRDPEDPGGRYISIWGEVAESKASDLYTEHVDDSVATGTTATVVGFRDPTEEEYLKTSDLMTTFETAIAEYFWPAIEQGHLEVYLQGPDDADPTEVDPSEVDSVRPFVDCFRRRDSLDEDLGSRGNVVGDEIVFELPDKKIGDEQKTEARGRVSVYARSPNPGDEESRRNEVAVFRGAGMVVDYVNMSGAASYGSDFYGLLVAGEARGWGADGLDIADKQVEEFLRISEPASHDEWKGYKNSRLQSTYKRGCAGTVEDLTSSDLRQCLQGLVATEVAEEGGIIEAMQQKIPRAGSSRSRSRTKSSSPSSVRSSDAFDVEVGFGYRNGRWQFQGHLGPSASDFDRWEARVEIVTIGEENNETGGIYVDADACDISTDGVSSEVEDGILVLSATDVNEPVEIDGASISLGDFDPFDGRLGRTRLVVDGDVEFGGEE